MRMFFALAGPVSSTPTRLYLAGVPGATNPAMRWNRTGTAPGADAATLAAGALDAASVARASAAAPTTSASFRAVAVLKPMPFPLLAGRVVTRRTINNDVFIQYMIVY